METVSLLNMLIETGDTKSTYQLLKKIKLEYPRSGSYFMDEAKWMEEEVLAKLNSSLGEDT